MPEPGDQHRQIYPAKYQPSYHAGTSHIAQEYTEEEAINLQSLLDRQLGPEYLSYRPGMNGSRVHYLEAWKVINLANEIFGFNGWSSSIQSVQVDYIDEFKESGRLNLGVSVIVRVTLKNGIYHEDIGYGCVENFKGKGAAFEKAKKEGTTDALKRALRTFGNVLGNCLYDKSYLKEIGKVCIAGNKYNLGELHRHPSAYNHKTSNIPPKSIEPKETVNPPKANENTASKNVPISTKETEIYEGDEFDDIDFQEIDKPVELEFCHQSELDIEDTFSNFSHSDLVEENIHVDEDAHDPISHQSKNKSYEQNSHQTPSHNRTNLPQKKKLENRTELQPPVNETREIPSKNTACPEQKIVKQTSAVSSSNHSAHLQNGAEHPPDYVPMFVSTRSALVNPKGAVDIFSGVAFNPHIDSPSIRKTPGLDHSKSTPIRKQNTTGSINLPSMANQGKRTPVARLVGAPPSNNRYYHPDPFQVTGTKRLAANDAIKREPLIVLNEMSDRLLNQQVQESFHKANDKNETKTYDTNHSTTAKRYKA